LRAALTLRQHETERQQLVLAQCLQALATTQQQISSLEANIAAAREEPSDTASIGWSHLTLMAYTQRIRNVQEHLRQQAKRQQGHIQQAQRALTEAMQREKSVDTLKDKWQHARTQHEWIVDEAMIADVVAHRHGQKHSA